jgi:hypothetical protein
VLAEHRDQELGIGPGGDPEPARRSAGWRLPG